MAKAHLCENRADLPDVVGGARGPTAVRLRGDPVRRDGRHEPRTAVLALGVQDGSGAEAADQGATVLHEHGLLCEVSVHDASGVRAGANSMENPHDVDEGGRKNEPEVRRGATAAPQN